MILNAHNIKNLTMSMWTIYNFSFYLKRDVLLTRSLYNAYYWFNYERNHTI